MTKVTITIAVFFAFAGGPFVPAQAQNIRSFISASGSDSNSCARTAPCRTLAAAFAQTNAGGEINMLDPAGYGTLTIDKAISIVNDGVGSAGVLVPSGAIGITINAGPSDVINLRGLIIEGAGVGMTGIQFNSGKALNVQNSVLHNLTATGIQFLPNSPSALFMSSTLVADIGNTAIQIEPKTSGTVTAVLRQMEVHNNVYGIYVVGGDDGPAGTMNAVVSTSSFSGSSATAVVSQTQAGAATSVMVRNCSIANNLFGVAAVTTGAILRLAQSAIAGNGTGWFINNGGSLVSYGDNDIDGNGGGQTAPFGLAKK
jgi:hypothetical protein